MLMFGAMLFMAQPINADEKRYAASALPAQRVISQDNAGLDLNLLKLKTFLKKQKAPLFSNAEDFINAAYQNNLPPFLLAAISGAESSFGKRIPANSYNPFGWGVYQTKNGWHVIYFASFSEAINTVSLELRKRFKDNLQPEQIGPTYAVSYQRWIGNVRSLMTQIENTKIDEPQYLPVTL